MRRCLPLIFFLLAGSVLAEDRRVEVAGQELIFAKQGAAPIAWHSCFPDCNDPESARATWFTPGDGHMRWSVAGQPAVTEQLASAVFSLAIDEADDHVLISASSAESFGGRPVVIRYRLPRQGYSIDITVESALSLQLELATGKSFIPEQLPGFGSIYSQVDSVVFTTGDLENIEPEDGETVSTQLHPESWFGVRNQYWLWLINPDQQTTGSTAYLAVNNPLIRVGEPAQGNQPQFHLYAGPTENESLRAAGVNLDAFLFAFLWDWLRWLSLGLLYLLGWLYGWVGNYGLAIILLSLAVKILMYPLTAIADRWQAQVNATSSLLKPRLDEIKQNHKGEEAHNKVLEVYREHSVHQFYTMKSLFGFLIQIPVFIAAFDMLAGNFVLREATFLWIADLTKPDRFMALPFELPFFGAYLNILPVVMTLLTILAAVVQQEKELTPQLMKAQRLKLYLMAAAFFILFYTFPAGMVLYWTANNLFHLLKILPARLLSNTGN
jgi:YidC/Oxa1 family membrane protein insertase